MTPEKEHELEIEPKQLLRFMAEVGMCVNFKDWCDAHAWEEDYRGQKTHTTSQLFDIWYNRVFGTLREQMEQILVDLVARQNQLDRHVQEYVEAGQFGDAAINQIKRDTLTMVVARLEEALRR